MCLRDRKVEFNVKFQDFKQIQIHGHTRDPMMMKESAVIATSAPSLNEWGRKNHEETHEFVIIF